MTRFPRGVPGLWIGIIVLAWLAGGASSFGAEGPYAGKLGTASLVIGDAEGRAGDTISLPVTIETIGSLASTVSFRLLYDPVKLEFESVALGAQAAAANREVSHLNIEPGTISFIVWGLSRDEIADGEILVVEFTITSASDDEYLAVTGQNGSAADLLALPILVTVFSGQIHVACQGPGPPPRPEASWGRTDGVKVTWEQSEGAAAYRVYRGVVPDEDYADPITYWLEDTLSYLDSTAEPASSGVTALGCIGLPSYYYWIQARNEEGCASALSLPGRGYRAAGKSLAAKTGACEDALPYRAGPDSALCLRLRSSEPIDLDTLWGEVAHDGGDAVPVDVRWIPAESDSLTDGWAAYEPEEAWAHGDAVTMTAGAAMLGGAPLEAVTCRFNVEGGVPLDDGLAVAVLPDGTVPPLDGGVGPAYAVGPERAYDVAQQVWLPIPEGSDARHVRSCYHIAHGPYAGWHAADEVEGFVVPDTYMLDESNGTAYLGFLVRHGGAVRLAEWADAGAADNVSASAGPEGLSDILVLAGLAAALWMAGRRYSAKPRIG